MTNGQNEEGNKVGATKMPKRFWFKMRNFYSASRRCSINLYLIVGKHFLARPVQKARLFQANKKLIVIVK